MTKSVYVQTNWANDRFEDETAWVQQTANEHGWPHAIVSFADFSVEDVRPQLDRLANIRWFAACGCNCTGTKTRSTALRLGRTSVPIPKIHRNVARLADYGWSFDLQVFAPQMAEAAGLAEACPDVTFILQHAGMLEDHSPQGRAAWRTGMAKLAQRPNVVSKLSGLGTFIHRNDAAHIAEILKDTVATFGAERCLFGSNFPIEKLWTTYRELVDAHLAAAASLRPDQRNAIFGGTAVRVYRLKS